MCSVAIPNRHAKPKRSPSHYQPIPRVEGQLKDEPARLAPSPETHAIASRHRKSPFFADLPSVAKKSRKQVATGLMFDGGKLKPAARKALVYEAFLL
jgi:hypothetical protein